VNQAQFFIAGVLMIWLIGTGKLAALMDALRNAPAGASSNPDPTDPNPAPPEGTPAIPGTVYTGPDGKMYIVGPDGNPIAIMG
jgi:hypothetical protein